MVDTDDNTPKTYEDRKVAGLCTRSGCSAAAGVDSLLCPPHHADAKARAKRSARKQRNKRRRLGLCRYCGGPKKRMQKSCVKCRVRRGRTIRLLQSGRDNAVDKRERIKARTITHEDGRTRYHGQNRRGNQPHAQLNEQDLEQAKRALDKAIAGVQVYQSSEVQAMPRIQREDVKAAAAAQVNHCIGFLDDVLERMGFFKDAPSSMVPKKPKPGR